MTCDVRQSGTCEDEVTAPRAPCTNREARAGARSFVAQVENAQFSERLVRGLEGEEEEEEEEMTE